MPHVMPPGKEPVVGILMGSANDLPIMRKAAETLVSFDVPCEIGVRSAHRNPEGVAEYAREAVGRGLKVIIAGAGGAAHLPGVLASLTPLPVIGVPIGLKAFTGMDSLLSIVQMPSGIPVATVGVDAGTNAGLLAARIIAVSDPLVADKLAAHTASILEANLEGDKKIEEELGG
jgi:5-(carboxyamino)imidazole ribonucleotide mutase